jgi:hypothetical protein
MNIAFIILSILNIFAELTELTYELGVITRRYLIPALVATYVVGEMVWDKCTTQEWKVTVYNTPLTSGLAHA